MGFLPRRAAPRGAEVLLLVFAVSWSMHGAQATRSLEQFNSCVVLGNNLLRRCNNLTCKCDGKSSAGASCSCKGECDPSFETCDGNSQSIQANCDCSSTAFAKAQPAPAPAPIPAPQAVPQQPAATTGSVAPATTASAAQGSWVNGVATFTGAPTVKVVPNGACGYGPMTAAQYPGYLIAGVGASNPLTQGPQQGCGACLELQCTGTGCDNSKPVTVMVYDNCDKCAANQVNLYATGFSKFASLDLGRVGIKFRQVACAFNGGIVVHIDAFRPEKGGYLKLALRNVAGMAGITSVASRTSDSTDSWHPMKNTYGAIWEASKLSALPLDLSITKADGQSVVLSGVISQMTTAGELPTTTNFN
eukprot:GHUV01003238.1.p1 GENE.GHUV01003238.1~~GHUV01003238.1.p1  ORF type:complete len:361 (+),score=78.47 GHUV01003238.1:811-1893(+)